MRGSSRVQLEVAFLDADRATAAPVPRATNDEQPSRTVLVVAAEADVRRYVRECLRERSELRVIEAATVSAAVHIATNDPPELLVVDDPERDVLIALPQPPAILIVDEVPRDEPTSGNHIRLLGRPFTAERLLAEMRQLLR
jgi:DNA-binding NarL/FixJ family response regulator